MSFFRPKGFRDFLLHLIILIGISFLAIVTVFYVWLPISTNHGETISVPNVQGMTVDELDEFLGKRNLRFEVTADSSFSADFPPLAVLIQVPDPDTKVKENRKIYVTLNAESPPKVRMPNVENRSLKSVLMTLKSYDLKLGDIKYIADEFFNVVLEARINGRAVLEGEKIEKGSAIDLMVGNGFGNTQLQSPNLIGLDKEEAEFAIIGSGLKVGKVTTTDKSLAGFDALDSLGNPVLDFRPVAPGSVQQQYPPSKRNVRIGDRIDLWVYKPDSVRSSSTILDNQ